MSVSLPHISNQQARRIFMARQGLCLPPHKLQSKEDLRDLIRQLGFVQIDSIRTVERAHHMILFTRNQTYRPEYLRQLLEVDRHLFEHWTHDAALIPTDFYPHWQQRFTRAEAGLRERWRKIRPKGQSAVGEISFEDMMEQVKTHVHHNGPTMSRDLKRKSETKVAKKNGWWEWHPSKTALEFLWRTGDLSITRRDGFQKVYDLSDRVIPTHARGNARGENGQTDSAYIDWACSAALDRLGFATSGELAAFWGSIKAADARAWCEANARGNLREVMVESADGSPPKLSYARTELLEELPSLSPPPDRLRLLSPFDPLIRDRKRLQRLFDFDYRIEIFVPEAQRKYGYYVFPLLEGDRMIGRIDMKAQRKDSALHVTGLWLEPKIKLTAGRKQKINAELNRQAKFIGMNRITFAPQLQAMA
ncbi:MAG: winged helix-turn-helix domain-containing protein [Rhodospirillaceae bacterium]|jgi:uncharacterized protein|nr:winged helix-turn-helix domain-containing protein [Rhodospirillaceae bacterium]MBT4686674.1 winged helix-turn-helix domain-containing protein [Rhodospirillaceae bacterium]MBT5082260.1 winged helix-turn-helix domain-containing protein [Rhodospirillaceae bacterium]MBT5526779.1 winged helix-turn-helix domain-containing protein [Rhodospirillaceae bacterium]MBT5879144.1 winged helix-turn-helix domain-containing protein [Rhodospirillaceae bacterium]